MSARRRAARTICRVVGRGGAGEGALQADPQAPPVFWGPIGGYEAVSRGGILFLLAPQPAHPSARAQETAHLRSASGT